LRAQPASGLTEAPFCTCNVSLTLKRGAGASCESGQAGGWGGAAGVARLRRAVRRSGRAGSGPGLSMNGLAWGPAACVGVFCVGGAGRASKRAWRCQVGPTWARALAGRPRAGQQAGRRQKGRSSWPPACGGRCVAAWGGACGVCAGVPGVRHFQNSNKGHAPRGGSSPGGHGGARISGRPGRRRRGPRGPARGGAQQ
jgi:hypothetical protein